jgi:putative membrane protein
MKLFLLNVSINILAILSAQWLVPGIDLQGPWWGLAVVALLFGLINGAVRPLLLLLTLPFVIVTLGLFTIVINALMLYLTSALARSFDIYFDIASFGSALLGALVISVVSAGLRLLSGESRLQIQVERGPRE